MKMAVVKNIVGLFAVICVFAISGVADAAPGFYFGTGFGSVFPSMSGDVEDLEPTGGINMELIHLGYNFTDRLGIGFQYGAAAGSAEDFLGDATVWSQGYLTMSFRYTHDTGGEFTPYVEAGAGTYDFGAMGDDGEFWADPTSGLRLAVGGNFYLGGFYLGPEISYHFAKYSEGEFDLDYPIYAGYPRKFDVDFDSQCDMIVLQLKVGYHFIRD